MLFMQQLSQQLMLCDIPNFESKIKTKPYKSIIERINAGEGIRTLEGLRQRILSPPPLSAREPLHNLNQYLSDLYSNISYRTFKFYIQ